MTEIISAIQGTPIPTLMLLGGILFLLLGISGGFAGKIVVAQQRQNFAVGLGIGLLILGVALYFFPTPQREKPEQPVNHPVAVAPNSDQTPSSPPASTLASKQPSTTDESDAVSQAKSWPLVMHEAFNDNSAKWFVGNFDYKGTCQYHSKQSIEDGLYRIDVRFNTHCQYYSSPTNFIAADFFVTLEARITAFSDSGSPQAVCGVNFRFSDEASYLLEVSNVHTYSLSVYRKNEAVKFLIPWTFSEQVNSSANRIGVLAIGNRISIYLNDHWVADMADNTATAGTLRFAIEGWGQDTRVSAEFDNFEVRRRP